MKAYQITWVQPNTPFQGPQHLTDKPMPGMDKALVISFFFGAAYFLIRGWLS